ncbi:hypothetical protein A4X09_0g7727 [Tilletia walkeri]|uniref:Uncharacterized protein n=1 Tax=Tilletia walkeri TaxID=117179 RepID=A0A8X7N2X5_9BASI|nr:hypothetical protein A4X09_0g7727 [Tilletia walkeri]
MRSLIKLGRAADTGIPITLGSFVYEQGVRSVRFSLIMSYYHIEDLKEGDATWPRGETLRVYVDESAVPTSTPFAAHANAAAYERYGQIRREVKVDGFPGRVFGITPRDQARSACLFMVGGRLQRKDEVTGHRINHLLRLMEAVLLAHSVKNGGSFSARPWAVGFDGNRQPIWQPSGVGHGGRMTLVKIDEEPVEPLLPPTFPRSSCLDRDLMLRALSEGTQRGTFAFPPSSNSELGLKLASILLIKGGRAEWLLQELGFDLDKALKALKVDLFCTSFDVWLRASWTELRAVESPFVRTTSLI